MPCSCSTRQGDSAYYAEQQYYQQQRRGIRPAPVLQPPVSKHVKRNIERNPPPPPVDNRPLPQTSGLFAVLGGIAGGAAGALTGNPLIAATGGVAGSRVADFAEAKLMRWAGMGDYTLKSNSLVQTGGVVDGNAAIIPQGNRAVRIVYKEYLGDVFTHPTVIGAFFNTTYSINPGLVATFPWLTPLAQQYEQWTPNGIVFEFRSTSSPLTTTQAMGSVIMATEYDVLDTAYANKQQMLNAAYSNEARPDQRIVHGLECDPRDNPQHIYFVRSGTPPTGADMREYDLAIFNIATQGGATANVNLGSLYIHYDITFRKEQLFNGLGALGLLSDTIYGVSGVDDATPLPVPSSLNVRTVQATTLMTVGGLGTTVTLPPWVTQGIWKIEYFYRSTAVGISTSAGFTTTTNCVSSQADLGSALTNGGAIDSSHRLIIADATATEISVYTNLVFKVTGPSPVVTMGACVLFGTPAFCWLRVSQVGAFWA